MSLDDLPKLVDDTTGTAVTCADIRRIGKQLEKGIAPSVDDIIMMIQDPANIRYRYTIERVQGQAIEILSRTWDSPEEALTDLRQAKRLINWTAREYKDISGDAADSQEGGNGTA